MASWTVLPGPFSRTVQTWPAFLRSSTWAARWKIQMSLPFWIPMPISCISQAKRWSHCVAAESYWRQPRKWTLWLPINTRQNEEGRKRPGIKVRWRPNTYPDQGLQVRKQQFIISSLMGNAARHPLDGKCHTLGWARLVSIVSHFGGQVSHFGGHSVTLWRESVTLWWASVALWRKGACPHFGGGKVLHFGEQVSHFGVQSVTLWWSKCHTLIGKVSRFGDAKCHTLAGKCRTLAGKCRT